VFVNWGTTSSRYSGELPSAAGSIVAALAGAIAGVAAILNAAAAVVAGRVSWF
jgi:hypothetical protein